MVGGKIGGIENEWSVGDGFIRAEGSTLDNQPSDVFSFTSFFIHSKSLGMTRGLWIWFKVGTFHFVNKKTNADQTPITNVTKLPKWNIITFAKKSTCDMRVNLV